MTPNVDWILFLRLMGGQCEPGLSEYEVTESRVRQSDIGKKAWKDMTATERAHWRVTQRDSELALPCYPSDVKRWADSQFLDISQELQYAINDEEIERIRLSEPEQSNATGRITSSATGRDRADKRWAETNKLKQKIATAALPMINRGRMNHPEIAAALQSTDEFSACEIGMIKTVVKDACRGAGRADLILGDPAYQKPA